MDALISPDSPELDVRQLSELAIFAKNLGKAPLHPHRRPMLGSHLTRMKGHGMEMLEVREYQASDDMRHIDWRVSAKTGKTHTRVYAEEREHSRILALDFSSQAYFGTRHTFVSTRMVQLQALIAWRTRIQNDKVGGFLHFADKEIYLPAKNQSSHFSALLSAFSDATKVENRLALNHTSSPWQALIKRNVRHQQIIITSDKLTLTDFDFEQLQRLSKFNLIHWISIEDERLDHLPEGQYRLEDTGGVRTIQVTKQNLENYQAQRLAAKQALNNQLSRIGIPFHHFGLEESPVQIARHLMAFGALS
ncbi:hypothetical protein MED121_23314 [Marinomonas sp. MED121]|uniref:DUF58 domain-containing protein n=1 Tax=Marinomonas sp. MED121 TaxID=314277 RepID=UPI00006904A6|nr:DUF58 domain-containing protein [Marinomonas sp. MED121]EAQ64730.1 hypothetical protein MED121_23314 [Marinomonas sp. MED121]